ncbi:DJ-1/PfpI family protein [Candidatus Woesearchaeota archaeon]|nr:DJ-1/PfpI family protein [Candidatus Woesearchaeota archaeon]
MKATVVLALLLITGCAKEIVDENYIELKKEELKANISGGENMKNVLFIIAQKNFRDEELETPKTMLEEAGHRCDVASITAEPAKGALGAVVNPDIAIKDVDINEYELVVVVGGAGSPTLMNYPEVLSVVRGAKKLAAICLGPMTLAKAGVLNGKKATVFETAESRKVFQENGVIFVRKDVVVDGDIVTANGPGAAEEFGEEVAKLLEK